MEGKPTETKRSGKLRRHAAAIIGVAIVVLAVIMSSVWMDAKAVAREDARKADEAPHLGWVNVHVYNHSNVTAIMVTFCLNGAIKDIAVLNPNAGFANIYETGIGDQTVLMNCSYYEVAHDYPYFTNHVARTIHVDEGIHSEIWFDVGW